MQINLDCLKDVLIYCVNNIDYEEEHNSWTTKTVNLNMLYSADELKDYNHKDIMRSVLKLKECHYIVVSTCSPEDKPYLERCSIEDITMRGYQFADTASLLNLQNKQLLL